jgi:lipoyl(octanoyl) transferase
MAKKLEYLNLGVVPYQDAWELQKNIMLQRKAEKTDDVLILLEHPHTYTLGKVAKREHLLFSEDELQQKNISTFEIDRGGDITYHGPGQVVGYPIINLKNWYADSHKYLRTLEEVIIKVLEEFGIEAGRNPKYTGVWVDDRKIAAIGIKISSWITMHGFAFNVNTDLSLFNGIIPCGIKEKDVTSLQELTGQPQDIQIIKQKILRHFMEIFDYSEVVSLDNAGKYLINTRES